MSNDQSRSRDASETLRLVASALSHDVKPPIRHAAHFIEFFEENSTKTSNHDVEGHLDLAKQSLIELSNMVQYLNRFASIRVDRSTFQSTSLAHLLKLAHDNSKIGFRRSSSILKVSGEANVDCDPVLMREAITHLTDNAVLYCDDEKTPQLLATIKTVQNTLQIDLEDNGEALGKNPGALLRLFQKGLHASKHEDRLGIGLSFAEHIIRLHGGWMELHDVASHLGGAKLTIILPI